MSALSVAGAAIAMQTGLGFAEAVDPTGTAPPAKLFTGFLAVLAVTLILVTDLHHVLLNAIADSYILFRPGILVPAADGIEIAIATITGAFKVAVQIAAPFLLFGLIFHFGSGILSRLVPQAQIFFLAVPAGLLIGFIVLMTTLGVMIVWFLHYFEAALAPFLR
jgi:flagellar biosynthetic protein FliR